MIIRAYICGVVHNISRTIDSIKCSFMEAIETFIKRVTDDGGTSGGEIITAKIDRFLGENNLYDDTKILICPEVAVKTRGTVPLYVTKSYDLSPNNNDAVQTTETNQPFLAGNIAPNERLGNKRIKPTLTGLAHDNISFTTAEPWSFTVAVNSFGYKDSGKYEYVNSPALIGVRRDGLLYLRNDSSVGTTTSISAYKYQRGKINFLTVIGLGTTIKVYFNGSYIYEVTLNSNFSFSGDNYSSNIFRGTMYYRRVQSGAMTLAQVQAEHAMLRSIYPEIESVQIGAQTWATSNLEIAATPMGNAIPEVTDAAVWASSATLYSDTYAATTGTEAEKVYAALKASAMWCHYNNDPVNGATYGKLYNWYAAKLLQTDIDAYNAANPTTPWGWKVPTDAEWETLRTTIASNGWNYDGSTDLGTETENKQGKALASDSLWTASAVEGAVGNTDYPDKRNISGFTGLPGGYRSYSGDFGNVGGDGGWWSSTEYLASYAWYLSLYYSYADVYRNSGYQGYGFSVRLLKS